MIYIIYDGTGMKMRRNCPIDGGLPGGKKDRETTTRYY